MRWGLVILAVAVVLGCAWAALTWIDLRPSAETGSLASGSEAIVYGKTGERITLENATADAIGLTYRNIDAGTKVRIIDDSGNRDSGERAVRITVIEGKNSEVVGEIRRKNLRPVK